MDYLNRLLQFVAHNDGLFTPNDVASIWKRNSNAVTLTAMRAINEGYLTMKCGVLYAI